VPSLVTAEYMRDWGKHTHGSPLYAELVEVVAQDAELLRVMNRIEHLPPPNLMFAAVQLLLMDGSGDPLSRYFRSVVADPDPPEGVGPEFRRFVLDHEERIVEMGNTRHTQTNEVRRCVALLPMVMMAGLDAFHLIDVGASAGLNLGLDRYGYRWQDNVEWHPDSSLVLEAESRGEPVRVHEIDVLSRIGLDLNPLDPADEEARRWLDALIWPEHVERRARLRRALVMLEDIEVEMIAGDALETLPRVLDRLPVAEPVVVMSSFTLNQFDFAERARLEGIVNGARSTRPIHRVSMGESPEKSDDWARLVADDGDGARVIGQAHPHGEWIELYP
jgi:hypothetical protein